MASLTDVVADRSRRGPVLDDCVLLIDAEVAHKGGLGGLAVKAAFAVVKAIKPGMVREAADRLLDDFAAALEPFVAAHERAATAQPLDAQLTAQAAQVAEALLGAADRRAAQVENRTLKATYAKLRPTAAKHVQAAVPAMGKLLIKHLTASGAAAPTKPA